MKHLTENEITVSDMNGRLAVDGICNWDKELKLPEYYRGTPIRQLCENAIPDEAKIESLVLPDTLEMINACALINHPTLREVFIPRSVRYIGFGAFTDCLRLDNIVFEEGSVLTEIQRSSFAGLPSLEFISLPKGLRIIGEYAFYKCEALAEVGDAPTLHRIEAYAFSECKKLQRFLIPKSVGFIGEGAFEGCSSLTELVFEDPTGWSFDGALLPPELLKDPRGAAVLVTKSFLEKDLIKKTSL